MMILLQNYLFYLEKTTIFVLNYLHNLTIFVNNYDSYQRGIQGAKAGYTT